MTDMEPLEPLGYLVTLKQYTQMVYIPFKEIHYKPVPLLLFML